MTRGVRKDLLLAERLAKALRTVLRRAMDLESVRMSERWGVDPNASLVLLNRLDRMKVEASELMVSIGDTLTKEQNT